MNTEYENAKNEFEQQAKAIIKESAYREVDELLDKLSMQRLDDLVVALKERKELSVEIKIAKGKNEPAFR